MLHATMSATPSLVRLVTSIPGGPTSSLTMPAVHACVRVIAPVGVLVTFVAAGAFPVAAKAATASKSTASIRDHILLRCLLVIGDSFPDNCHLVSCGWQLANAVV